MNIQLKYRLGSELWLKFLKYSYLLNRITKIAKCIFIFRVTWGYFFKKAFSYMDEFFGEKSYTGEWVSLYPVIQTLRKRKESSGGRWIHRSFLIVRKQDYQLNPENMATVFFQGLVCTNLFSLQKIEDCVTITWF